MSPQASVSFSPAGLARQAGGPDNGPYLSWVERFGALAALGQARSFEWQAAAVHVAADEWYRYQYQWLDLLHGLDELSQGLPWMRPKVLENTVNVVGTWCSWSVKTYLSVAQGLLTSLTPETLGLPGASGRRSGFDLGRRSGAVVIDFPDRRAGRK